MSLTDIERQTIVQYQYEKAVRFMEEARTIISVRLWEAAANRLYYALYHAVTALLVSNKLSASTHQGTVTLLGKHFVQTGLFTTEEGRFYSQLQTLRENGDYNCFIQVTEEDILPRIEPAQNLLDKIGQYLQEKGFIPTETTETKE